MKNILSMKKTKTQHNIKCSKIKLNKTKEGMMLETKEISLQTIRGKSNRMGEQGQIIKAAMRIRGILMVAIIISKLNF